MEKQSLE